MEAFLLFAIVINEANSPPLDQIPVNGPYVYPDGRPTAFDRNRLPSEEKCREQVCKYYRIMQQIDYELEMSPSRRWLIENRMKKLKESYQEYYDFWSTAVTVKSGGFLEPDRDRMEHLKDLLGDFDWNNGNWPYLIESEE